MKKETITNLTFLVVGIFGAIFSSFIASVTFIDGNNNKSLIYLALAVFSILIAFDSIVLLRKKKDKKEDCSECKPKLQPHLIDFVPSIRYVRETKRKNGVGYSLRIPIPGQDKSESFGVYDTLREAFLRRETTILLDPRFIELNPRGVTFIPERNVYKATISYKNRTIFVGHYDTQDEAIKERKKAILSIIY